MKQSLKGIDEDLLIEVLTDEESCRAFTRLCLARGELKFGFSLEASQDISDFSHEAMIQVILRVYFQKLKDALYDKILRKRL